MAVKRMSKDLASAMSEVVAAATAQTLDIMHRGHAFAVEAESPEKLRTSAEAWRIGHDGARKALGMDRDEAGNQRPVAVDIMIQGRIRPIGVSASDSSEVESRSLSLCDKPINSTGSGTTLSLNQGDGEYGTV